MAFVGLALTLFDIRTDYLLDNRQLSIGFIYEVLFDGVVLPVSGIIVLGLLLKLTSAHDSVLKNLSFKSELSRQIDNSPQLNDLIRVVVEYPCQFLPIIGSDLVLYEPALNRFETRASWGLGHTGRLVQHPWDTAPNCSSCASAQGLEAQIHCCFTEDGASLRNTTRYCVPLMHASTLVAMLYLYFPGQVGLTREQQETLKTLAPEMALAIDAARNKRLNTVLQEDTEAWRRRMVHELHDNLAHGLFYIRSQLDQLSVINTLDDVSDTRYNLEKLRQVAESVHMDLRSILKELEENPVTELSATITDYIQSIQHKIGFEIRYTSQGQPQRVPTRVALHITYIIREIFHNIEKHAGASLVDVRLEWRDDAVILNIKDNGSGFDYQPELEDGHLGLKIIRERAAEINAQLAVNSVKGTGTEASLWLPLWSNPAAMFKKYYEGAMR
jgi:signal transduction histidine kinase